MKDFTDLDNPTGIEMMVSFYLMEVQMRLWNSLTKGTLVSNICDSHMKHHASVNFLDTTVYKDQDIRMAFAHISNLLTASSTCTGKVLIARQFSRAELEENV